VRELLQGVERVPVGDEADDVPSDPAVDDGQPLGLPGAERLVPGQVEEVGLPGARHELELHAQTRSRPT
jgi:hypothetical protein